MRRSKAAGRSRALRGAPLPTRRRRGRRTQQTCRSQESSKPAARNEGLRESTRRSRGPEGYLTSLASTVACTLDAEPDAAEWSRHTVGTGSHGRSATRDRSVPQKSCKATRELRQSRLVDVDPCDDMFEHVCGRWTSVYPEQQDLFQILENRLRVSLLERVDQVTAGSDNAVDKAAAASEGPLNFVVWLVEALRAVAAHKKRFLQPSPGDPSASINRDDWDLSGISVGAYYVVVYHIVYLPGSILMPPFLVPYGPNSYNYGAIGKVIGHELTHAFDPKFIDLSPKGEKHVFYSPRFFQQLTEVQNCIILQANKLTQSAIAGNNSASEAFADSAGVEVAYLAYRALLESDRLTGAGYDTADQTFFAATCYMFCQAVEEYSEFSIYLPHRLRCKQPCLNTQEFANAFGCKEGSPMFPRHRCDVHDFLKITQGGRY
ncbi:hypothetical protein HPB50_022178 [Hyalomma asiaticum]|uniref:Uncharacterized protein n=1 Tax=Hyalomma asiaticum TaxID=266040 RepID=A0ACB7RZF2_HYAAI|nr:hypothetical protein HPB50_022178 [Hyalomma asiaticum]